MRRWTLIALLLLIVLPALGLAAWIWASLSISYSTGERGGFVQKISRKGWVCKTWEGELAMTTQAGVPPQLFQFSVRDEAVAAQLMRLAGQRVVLSYEQHRGVPGNCFGETEYFITATRPISGNP